MIGEATRRARLPGVPGTYREWRERCYKVFKDAGVKMTPHGFRHYRIQPVVSARRVGRRCLEVGRYERKGDPTSCNRSLRRSGSRLIGTNA